MVGVRLVFRTAVVFSGEAIFRSSALATPMQVEPEDHVGVAGVGASGRFDGTAAEQDVRDHGAAFLRGAGLVERRDVEAVDPCGGGEQRVNGHNAGAADAGADDAIAVADRRDFARRGDVGVEGVAEAPCGAGRCPP